MGEHRARGLVAVLGGGQLGRMLGLAGVPLGLGCRFLDPAADAPARVVGPLVTGALGDEEALTEVAAGAAVVTYEWEGVPAAGARFLEARGYEVLPPPAALDVAQDRLAEKTLFRRLGISTPEFAAVDDRAGLDTAVDRIGLPAVLKTRRGGYDGKGQRVLRTTDDAGGAWEELGGGPLLLEELVPFDREVSIIAVRGRDGATAHWPLVENEHRDGILRVSRAPAPRTDPALDDRAAKYATVVLDALGYVGVLAIELFQVDGELLANELAPRVHNSGHWTIEGAATSQFENHLRAVVGWPLGSTAARGVAGMVNCIGAVPDPAAVLAVPGAHLHDYGKAPRPGRKLGHVTVLASAAADRDERVGRIAALVG
ncbi:MAG TPA: 5-(carboxyamino)imidazole ribonucleotide synthase [Acidimicrobiia bacterium]